MTRLSRLGSLLIALAVLGSVSVASPTSVRADMWPGDCGPSNDGQLKIDPETNWAWRCTYFASLDHWDWLPLGDVSWLQDFELWGIESSANGCVKSGAGIGTIGGTIGATSMVGSFWAGSVIDGQRCDAKRSQPPGELRARGLILRWNGSTWTVCRDTGFVYNPMTTWVGIVSYNMGSVADCGSGIYRMQSQTGAYDYGAWRTNTTNSGSRSLQ